jgi:putative transposase
MSCDLPRRKRIRLDSGFYREPGRVFSVTLGTIGRQRVFADVPFGLECVDLLRSVARERSVAVPAYCLMPDHVHLLLGCSPGAPLPSSVQAWKSLCYRAWRRRGQARSFWQRSYFDHALKEDEDLRVAVHYVLGNPVRTGLASKPQDYPLSGSLVFDVAHLFD